MGDRESIDKGHTIPSLLITVILMKIVQPVFNTFVYYAGKTSKTAQVIVGFILMLIFAVSQVCIGFAIA